MEFPRLNWSYYSCPPTPQSRQPKIQAMPVTYTTAHGNAGSLTHWVRPGIEPASSRVLVGFVTAEPQWELPQASISSLLYKKFPLYLYKQGWLQMLPSLVIFTPRDGFPFNTLSHAFRYAGPAVGIHSLRPQSCTRRLQSPQLKPAGHPDSWHRRLHPFCTLHIIS